MAAPCSQVQRAVAELVAQRRVCARAEKQHGTPGVPSRGSAVQGGLPELVNALVEVSGLRMLLR